MGIRKKSGIILSGVLLLALILSCAPQATPTPMPPPTPQVVVVTPMPTATPTPRYGDTLRHVAPSGLLPMFDPHLTISYMTMLASSFVRRFLLKYPFGEGTDPADFTLLPDLAEKWEQASPTVSIFSLRKGVKWDSRPPLNGRELVAADVKYSFERAIAKSGYGSMLGKITSIETPDKYTVKVTHAEPIAVFLHNLAQEWTQIVPKEVVDQYGDLKGPESFLGHGPFIMEKYEPGVKIVFKKNPDYYLRGRPYVDTVEWLNIPEKATQLSLFRTGKVDFPFYDARIAKEAAGSLKLTNPDYNVVFWNWLAVRRLGMRLDKPELPFQDVRVRRAMSLAVDRKVWVENLLLSQGWTDPGPVPAPMKEWKLPTAELGPGAKWLEYNPTEAKKLLAEAGYPKGFKTKCTHYPGYGPEYVDELELLVHYLKAIGIEMEIINEEYGKYIAGSYVGKYDETSWGPTSVWTEVDSYLWLMYYTGEASNVLHLSDPALDKMLEAQRATVDKAARKKIIDDIQKYIADKVYYIYTPYPKQLSAWTPWVKNYFPKNSFDRGSQLEVVWVKPH